MKFFASCQTLKAVKDLYKQLAMAHHPDRGGDTATMQAINAEYAFACAKAAKGEGMSDEQTDFELRISEDLRQALERIIHLPDILIEIIGHWIWVTGNTRPVKDELRAAQYRFCPRKVAWQYHNPAFSVRGRGGSLDKIRRKYGSQSVQGNYRKQLNDEQ